LVSRFARSASTAEAIPTTEPQGKTEADLEADLAALEIGGGFPIISEVEETIKVRTGADMNEFSDHLHEHAVYNEGEISKEDASPYSTALGLDFKTKYGISAGFLLTAISKEWYIMNEETFIVFAFAGAVATVYTMVGEDVARWHNDWAKNEIKEQNAAEDAHIASCRAIISGFDAPSVKSSLDGIFAEESSVIEAEAKARVIAEQNELIKKYDSTLSKMVVAKAEETNKAYQTMLSETVALLKEESQKADFKKKALKYALDAAVGKKVGTSPTVELYGSILDRLSKK
jgi:hypothetical protein